MIPYGSLGAAGPIAHSRHPNGCPFTFTRCVYPKCRDATSRLDLTPCCNATSRPANSRRSQTQKGGTALTFLRKQAPLLWLLSIPLLGLIYSMQNHPRGANHVLATELDRLTPFVPVFSVFYFVWYPFLLLVLALLLQKSRAAYYRTLIAVCIGILIANAIFLIYPTYVPRPQLQAGWNYFVPITYRLDEPYNGFPSIHVISSYLMLRASGLLTKRIRIGVVVMACLIILSTMFIKQHVLADVMAGIAIGESVYRITGMFMRAEERLSARIRVSRTDRADM